MACAPPDETSARASLVRRTASLNAALANIGFHLRAWRCYRQQTQRALGDAVGLSQTSVSNYECGARDIRISALLEISTCLDVELRDLITTLPPAVVTRLPPGPARSRLKATRGVEH